jgi:eukaryotic-like serine/threonine-protein kinase
MSAPSWADLEALFHEALARAPADRAAFLAERCAGRPELRAEVEALLRAHDEAASTLELPPVPPQKRLKILGTRLGVYEVTAQIGEGGMGQVYRATDTKLKRQVAIKILPPWLAADPDRLARFQREAEVLASLNHPNIAIIHGLEDADGVKALVMEIIEGEDLSQRIARGAVPLDDALPIAKQVAEALEAAHERGIIHRDLKPTNIKVRPDGTVKVLDFGLAKAMESTGVMAASGSMAPTFTTPAMTRAGMILGTAAYMSPEQARGKVVDTRADIWAFGAVLFEMLTGTRAFPGEDITETLAAVMKLDPTWDALGADVPARVHQVLRLCLQKDPRKRAQAIGDVRLALEGAFETAAAHTTGTAATAVTRRHAPEYIAWGLAIAATLLAIGVSVLYLRGPRQTDTLVRFGVASPADVVRPVGAGFGVTPDGQTLAFVARGVDGVSRIFIRRLDAAEAQPLAGTDLGTAPFWAPDGRSLGFAKEGGLYRVALDGTAPRRLCDVPGTLFRGGTWGSRGVIVFAQGAGGLLQVPDTGGTPAPVTMLDEGAKEASHVGPWFLPDGRHVLFLALAVGQTRGIIWATSISDPARTRLVESSGPAAYAAGWLLSTTDAPRRLVAQLFDPERLMLQGMPQPVRDRLPAANTGGNPGFAVSSSGVLIVDRVASPRVSQLVWMDRKGREVATVSRRATIPSFALAPDEGRVVADVVDNDSATSDLWLFEAGRPDGTRLTYEGSGSRPLWSLDGRRIYFTGSNDLRMLAIGATASASFENPGSFVHFEDVTRDGRYFVFKSSSELAEIWIQRVDSAERRTLVRGSFRARWPRVSPDSRWLAYTLDLPSGPEVFAQPFDRPGDRIQVSVKGGFGPVWRDDGRELYYESSEGLMAVPMTERGDALEAGTPQILFRIHTQGSVFNQPHNVEVAAHGQKFLVNTIVGDSDNVPLEVTLNWTAELKKK